MKKFIKKLFPIILTAMLIVTMLPTMIFASEDEKLAQSNEWTISKSKIAANLDENFESKVTLSLPSEEEKVEFDVVFVLDKSESTTKIEISNAVQELFEEIQGSQGVVNIGVVTFNKGVANSLPLTSLTEGENLDAIKNAIEFSSSSGTNIHAGLLKGMKLLNDGNADEKYLILASDGITYLYNDEDGNGPKTISNHGQSSPEDYCYKYGGTAAQEDWAEYLKQVSEWVSADGDTYEGTYNSWNDIEGASKYLYDTSGEDYEHAMSVDKALLRTYEAYTDAIKEYGKDHVYAIGRTNEAYPWAGSFMDYLSGISANEQDIDKIITDDIIYLLDEGSYVEDYMGYVENDYDFDFVNEADAMTLKVGSDLYNAEKIGDNKYGFKPADGSYAYTVTYDKGNGKDEEHFVWNINEPVSNFAPVQLTYTVKLINPETDPGNYGRYDANGSHEYDGLYTNNKAVLYPVDSNGKAGGAELFAMPTVSYSVEAQSVSPENQDQGQSGVDKNTVSEDAPLTGDQSGFLLLAALILLTGSIIAGCAALRKRTRA